MEIVQCWIEHPVQKLNQTYTYLSSCPVETGTRVQVDFNGRRMIGFAESCTETDETQEQAEKRIGMHLKFISSALDQESLITPELHDLALWMADMTVSPVISCFQAMLPGKIKPISGAKGVLHEKWVECSDQEVTLTCRQIEAYTWLKNQKSVPYSQLRQQYPNQAKILVDKGAAVLSERVKEAVQKKSGTLQDPLKLTDLQQKAMDEIKNSSDPVYLLRGVTGSGKTEIYLHLAAEALAQGKQVLILVPEISLTPQMIERVRNRFGSDLAVYHSGLNAQEKYEQYRMVKSGKASVVVGTRSSVFLPFASLGLIVMDEEQDGSYKQENQPAYHCRDIAIWRGKYHGCKVLLGSATPSLESYARARKGVYHLVELKERINKSLPLVTVVNMKECLENRESYILSNILKEKIQKRLDQKEQCILLLNRRGYHTLLRCRNCQEVIVCPHCDLAMSYHRDEKVMKCHACGTSMPVPEICPSCGQKAGWSSYGFGTEKLEQELHAAFPQARLLRMDADTTSRKNGHEKILHAFEEHQADILLGTQMIAKGLDYPHVTLVGIINGDEGLSRTDYRSCETTFDLLMQACGRSGRASQQGEAVFQVYEPNHYAVRCAAKQDYETFFAREMQFRHAGQYPPYTYLISLTAVGTDSRKVDETALWLKQNLHGSYKTIGVITLLKIQDRFRDRILLKGKNPDEMRQDIQKLYETEGNRMTGVRIDVNPMVLE